MPQTSDGGIGAGSSKFPNEHAKAIVRAVIQSLGFLYLFLLDQVCFGIATGCLRVQHPTRTKIRTFPEIANEVSSKLNLHSAIKPPNHVQMGINNYLAGT
jgi:hypothetical protein